MVSRIPPPDNGEPIVVFDNSVFFKWTLIIVTIITLSAFVTSIGLTVNYESPSPGVIKAIDRTWAAFWLGFGALVGLLAGKSL